MSSLPFVTEFAGLAVFAVFFGLDYIATVPPTVALVADRFGRANVGAVFGWVFFGHQIGAALASYLGGIVRVSVGDYTAAFLGAGVLAILASLMVLVIRREATLLGPRRPERREPACCLPASRWKVSWSAYLSTFISVDDNGNPTKSP